MNPEHESELEALVDGELKALPPLSAPPELAPRILALIAARSETPWYRRAWTTWPLRLQAASLVTLLVIFAGFSFCGDQAVQLAGDSAVAHKLGSVWSLLQVLRNTCGLLLGAVHAVIQQIGTVYLCAAIAVVVVAYGLCVALGSACLRFALPRN